MPQDKRPRPTTGTTITGMGINDPESLVRARAIRLREAREAIVASQELQGAIQSGVGFSGDLDPQARVVTLLTTGVEKLLEVIEGGPLV